jgi:uracil-DNA glycosylase
MREEDLKKMMGEGWFNALRGEFEKPYMKKISEIIKGDLAKGSEIYPPLPLIFNAYRLCSIESVKVIIIGQDPYHTPGVAHGLSFSSKENKIPPSLRNIFLEIHKSLNIETPFEEYFKSSDLTKWALQGVFLLNTSLTVIKGMAGSHSKIGWQEFTTETIRVLNKTEGAKLFLLWGKHAQGLRDCIGSQHRILEAPHPSPFSARTGFFECGHFVEMQCFVKQHYGIDFNLST